jgi:AcrR family transcriptional regulator
MKTRLSASPDRRIQRTRKALLEAFTALFLERRYDHIKVADIIGRADVGRSTFYEHFADKEAILAESIRRPFGLLATSADVDGKVDDVRRVLEHFWQNQRQAQLVFAGAARRPVARILASMIEERLVARAQSRSVKAPLRLVAVALADAQLGAITAWLTGEATCTAAVLAETLAAMTQGAIASVRSGK